MTTQTQGTMTKKANISAAILELYKQTHSFNLIAGNTIDPVRIKPQSNLVLEETKEMVLSALEKDNIEKVDGCLDGLVTCSNLIMLLEGNTALLADAPMYLNHEGLSLNELIGRATTAILDEDWIELLNYLEDICYEMEGDTLYNIEQVWKSNLSKFPLVSDVKSPDDVADAITDEGRYTGVDYHTSKNIEGEEVYVFTATYDTKEKKAFSSPKIVKPTGFFVAPDLKV